MSHCVFIDIDYDEGVSGSYRAVVIRRPDGVEERFATGDPVADFARATLYGSTLAAMEGRQFMELSSLSHFTMDDHRYCWDDDNMLQAVEAG